MKESVKEKWIEALKYGRYKQVKGHLKKMGGYSCLGVLCDISDIGYWAKNKYSEVYARITFGHGLKFLDCNYLPQAVIRYAKIQSVSGALKEGVYYGSEGNCIYHALTSLNDAGMEFDRIAEIIEKDLVL